MKGLSRQGEHVFVYPDLASIFAHFSSLHSSPLLPTHRPTRMHAFEMNFAGCDELQRLSTFCHDMVGNPDPFKFTDVLVRRDGLAGRLWYLTGLIRDGISFTLSVGDECGLGQASFARSRCPSLCRAVSDQRFPLPQLHALFIYYAPCTLSLIQTTAFLLHQRQAVLFSPLPTTSTQHPTQPHSNNPSA